MLIDGRKKVKTVKREFKEEFGLTLRIYDGRGFADDEATLASIRKGDNKGGELSPKRNMKIGNVEKNILDIFGIKTQLASKDDSYLCDNDHTLAKALEVDEEKIIKKSKEEQQSDSSDNLTLDEIIKKIKVEFANHEDLNEIITDLSEGDYIDHWASNFLDENFGNNQELSVALFKIAEARCSEYGEFNFLGATIASENGLNDKKWAKELFEKSISLIKNKLDLVSIADNIASENGLNDKKWSHKLYEEIENNMSDLSHYNNLIVSLNRDQKDYKWAIKIINDAIEKIKNKDNFLEFTDTSEEVLKFIDYVCDENLLNDKEIAKEIFDMNKEYTDITSLLESSRKVLEIYDNEKFAKDYVEECLDKAIDCVEQGYYCDIYFFIKNDLKNEEHAIEFKNEYYDEMEVDHNEYGSCEEVFNDEDNDEVEEPLERENALSIVLKEFENALSEDNELLVQNFKIGYTLEELEFDEWDDYEDGFRGQNHVLCKFTMLSNLDTDDYVFIPWNNTDMTNLYHNPEYIAAVAAKIFENTSDDIFGSNINSKCFKSLILMNLDEYEDYPCAHEVIETIGGYLEIEHGTDKIPEEYRNALFSICENITDCISIKDGEILVNNAPFDIEQQYEADIQYSVFTEDVMNY